MSSEQYAEPANTAPQATDACLQGLQILAQGVDSVVDIVAVHGLNGHYLTTWTADNDVLWLRDLLPSDIPKARIYSWGYDARTHGASHLSLQYLYDHALDLVSALCRKRKLSNTMERPIIFVAHSLGGLVVKSALIHADAARQEALDDHRAIKISTYGIIFMGTPHQGSNAADLGSFLVNVASMFVPTNDRILKHLKRDSEWLQQQLGQFGPISRDFVTKFEYESYETPTRGPSISIVPRSSAVVPGQANAEVFSLNADHNGMVKYRSSNDGNYTTILEHLQIMAKDAPEVIRLRWEIEERVDTARGTGAIFAVEFALPDVVEVPNFVARSEELAEIHLALEDHQELRKTVIVHGLGGMGKTQISAQYAKLHHEDYSAIFWMNAKDDTSLKQSYHKAANHILQSHSAHSTLKHAVESDDPNVAVQEVKLWLNKPGNNHWLMIFDNYDTPPPQKQHHEIPSAPKQHHDNLDETSGTGIGNDANTGYDIQPFMPETHHGALEKLRNVNDSLRILSDTSRRQNLTRGSDMAGAVSLAEELDGLPLALATAGAYLRNVTTKWLQLQESSPFVRIWHDPEQKNHVSAMLLCLWAYFDNEDVWFENMGWLRELAYDVLGFNTAVRLLCEYGLVEPSTSTEQDGQAGSPGYSMHALHCVAILSLNVNVDGYGKPSVWQLRRRLLRPARECYTRLTNKDEKLQLGKFYRKGGRLGKAKAMFQRVLDRKDITDYWHSMAWTEAMESMAFILQDERQFASAEKIHRSRIEWYEIVEGSGHPMTCQAILDLGFCYTKQGRLEDAERMVRIAAEGFERTLGPGDMFTLNALVTLAELRKWQSFLADAEQLYIRVVQGYESTWGLEHSITLKSIVKLGLLYNERGHFSKAEGLFKRALQGVEKINGPDNLETLNTALRLAMVQANQGNFDEAEKGYKQILQELQTASLARLGKKGEREGGASQGLAKELES
ncbi:hypothetical protein QBC34DRAFT_459505 [Podospora aff. communis PSN243]|uniref:DUF676 domain-containing protein n=1 Tax=Podospora aff. communis PSN243 TaxID=3040156 RepID=A0AAV9GUC7_9PEZI|nr:hypothetical protein QBC34DRAFT_459505 [Podospora aff. communis PSN243]